MNGSFSRADSRLIASSGRATSMSFRLSPDADLSVRRPCWLGHDWPPTHHRNLPSDARHITVHRADLACSIQRRLAHGPLLLPRGPDTYAATMAATHLLVLGNAEAARWVFENQRMAFSEVGRRTAARLSRGDTLIFYASLKCWPGLGGTRPDSGLLIADAVVLTEVSDEPASLRWWPPLPLRVRNLLRAPRPGRAGVPIGNIRNQLELTAGRANYGQALRRTPVLLSRADAALIRRELKQVWQSFEDSINGYRELRAQCNDV